MSLYKYFSSDRSDVLESLKIRLTQPIEWNDPFEMRPSFLYDSNTISQDDSEDFDEYINTRFVSLSLTENYEDILMWAHYANNHSGFLIEFNDNDEFFNCKNMFLFKILYSNIRPVILEDDAFNLSQKLFLTFKNRSKLSKLDFQRFSALFTKSLEWSNEKEWRLLTILDHAQNHIQGVSQSTLRYSVKALI